MRGREICAGEDGLRGTERARDVKVRKGARGDKRVLEEGVRVGWEGRVGNDQEEHKEVRGLGRGRQGGGRRGTELSTRIGEGLAAAHGGAST